MSVLKLSLLLSSSVSFHLGLGRPSSVNAEDRVMVTSIRERIWQHVALPADLLLKITTWLATLAESAVIVNSRLDTPRLPGAFLDALGPAEASTLTVPFVLGASLVIAGGIARIVSFRTLGPYYTFVQCLRREHKLVTTGPYSVVRHPGYSGLFLCVVGWGVVHCSPGSWLRTSGVLEMGWVKAGFACSCLIIAASIVTVFHRSMEEDRYLSHKFGKEWDDWAGRVRYRFVPFVY